VIIKKIKLLRKYLNLFIQSTGGGGATVLHREQAQVIMALLHRDYTTWHSVATLAKKALVQLYFHSMPSQGARPFLCNDAALYCPPLMINPWPDRALIKALLQSGAQHAKYTEYPGLIHHIPPNVFLEPGLCSSGYFPLKTKCAISC
jgi:hypothetical protein